RTEIADEGFTNRVASKLPYRHHGMAIPSTRWAGVLLVMLVWVVQRQLFMPILYDVLYFAIRVIQQIKFVHVVLAGTFLVGFASYQMQQEG
ncbi:MAG: hypothetical protein Q4E55_09675, partial [Bacteroidales bacterium]|nr:hypothetical protein [Bacteroidales bacterium]